MKKIDKNRTNINSIQTLYLLLHVCIGQMLSSKMTMNSVVHFTSFMFPEDSRNTNKR